MEREQNVTPDLRIAVARLLEEKGYKVRSIAKGSGSPEFSKIEAVRGSEKLVCAVKFTTKEHGRIHFTRDSNGKWKVLDDVDHVIHAWQKPTDTDSIEISLYDAKVIRDSFERNFTAQSKRGMGHIPCWLGPILETKPRFVGSGFGQSAIWRNTVPLAPAPAPFETAISPHPVSPEQSSIGIMDRIKQMLSEHMGVRPELIEVDVRVKL